MTVMTAEFLKTVVFGALAKVGHAFVETWPYLLASALIVVAMRLFMDQQRVADFLRRYQRSGVVGATTVAVATPLCSCGTMAVSLSMMAAQLPWAPLVAFMVASPLTSPQEILYAAALFGWPFAAVFFVASIVLGLAGGLTAALLEGRGWFANQARFKELAGASDGDVALEPRLPGGGCSSSRSVTARVALRDFYRVSRRLLFFFVGFTFLGYVLNGLIPQAWIATFFSGDHAYGVPLAATLGVPLYLNNLASMPLVRSMIEAGMSPGAAMAFLITGAGTSLGAIAGALTIARWRVVGLVVGTLWVGAIVFGYLYNALI
jgi:uncharacterized membrane protein YraQ (UPF0718 family)